MKLAGEQPDTSWLNEAAKARIEGEDLQHVLAELFAETGGPPSEGELAHAATRLVNADCR